MNLAGEYAVFDYNTKRLIFTQIPALTAPLFSVSELQRNYAKYALEKVHMTAAINQEKKTAKAIRIKLSHNVVKQILAREADNKQQKDIEANPSSAAILQECNELVPSFNGIESQAQVVLNGAATFGYQNVSLFNGEVMQSIHDKNASVWFKKRFTVTEQTVFTSDITVKNTFRDFKLMFAIQGKNPLVKNVEQENVPFKVKIHFDADYSLKIEFESSSSWLPSYFMVGKPFDWRAFKKNLVLRLQIAFYKVDSRTICTITVFQLTDQNIAKAVYQGSMEIEQATFSHIKEATLAKTFWMGFSAVNIGYGTPLVEITRFDFNSAVASQEVEKEF